LKASESKRTIRGRVFTGAGVAAGYTQLGWVVEQVQRGFGFEPYPGTLNMRVEGPDGVEALAAVRAEPGVPLAAVRAEPGVPLEPAPGNCAARCYSARLAGRQEAALVVPLVAGYPDDVLELLAPVRLRDTLGLSDGDLVEVEIGLTSNERMDYN
jgi:CTP-dependent riboflavin kinase